MDENEELNLLAKKYPHQFLVCLRTAQEIEAFHRFLSAHRKALFGALDSARETLEGSNRAAYFPHEGDLFGWPTESSFIKAELRARERGQR